MSFLPYSDGGAGRLSLGRIAIFGTVNPISPRSEDDKTKNAEPPHQRKQQAKKDRDAFKIDQAGKAVSIQDQLPGEHSGSQQTFFYASHQVVNNSTAKEAGSNRRPERNDKFGSKAPTSYHDVDYSGGSCNAITADSIPARQSSMVTRKNRSYEYQDYVNLPMPALTRRKARGGVVPPFPEQLHRMLEESEICGFSDVVSWQPHGRSFSVHKKELFQLQVMPNYFKTCNIASFQRQLNIYGFLRLRREESKGSYFHERFLRGRPDLCVGIPRLRPGKDVRVYLPPHMEPNFCRIPPAPASSCSYQSEAPLGSTKPGNQAEAYININENQADSSPSSLEKSSCSTDNNSCPPSHAGNHAVGLPPANVGLLFDAEQSEEEPDHLLKYFLELRESGGCDSPPCAADILLDLDF